MKQTKRIVEPTLKKNGKRNLFAELKEGMDALAEARLGKQSLRTHSMEFKPASTVAVKK
jgi:putative transcriptional regulator